MPPHVVVLADASDAGDSSLLLALKHAGYQVHVLSLGTIDPGPIARFKPQAVVFNVGRQSANAYEFLATLRKNRELKDAVMIGVFGEKECGTGSQTENFDHRLRRPVNVDALLCAIDSPRRAPYRVLLVEDHMSLANATAFLMRHEGLEVWIATTGREALEVADKVRPEIVLCDLLLPDMTGLDVARELRARPGAKDVLIAIHTAMSEGSQETYRQHTNEFVNLFLPKPLTVEKVDVLISELLALWRSVSQAAVHRRRH